MIVTELSPNYPECLEGPQDDLGFGRSRDTLHLGSILHDLRESLSPRGEPNEDDLAFYASGGFMWERIWDRAHQDAINRGLVIRPGEFDRDGIVGSPDALDLENARLVELKCRWQSSRKFDHLEKNYWYELLQIKCYLAMLGWTEAEFTVFYVCGDWRPPIPKVRSVLLAFTELEIEESWSMVVRHARGKGWI